MHTAAHPPDPGRYRISRTACAARVARQLRGSPPCGTSGTIAAPRRRRSALVRQYRSTRYPAASRYPGIRGSERSRRFRRSAGHRHWRTAMYDMYDTTPAPAGAEAAETAEAVQAVQVALDRRDNGGPAGR
ncbi:hypothetical protein GCM10027570_22980 [Streptomonospora sediminis]